MIATSPFQRLREVLPPDQRLLVDQLSLDFWTRPGKFRAYGHRKDAYLELDPNLVPEDLQDYGSTKAKDPLDNINQWALEKGYF